MKRPIPRNPDHPSKEKRSQGVGQSSRRLKKQKFWAEFDPTTYEFFKIMMLECDFRNKLVIPGKFAKRFREKLSDTVSLKGPSGHIWNVKLIKTSNDWLFQNGWDTFVEDHCLAHTDLLVFRYEGESSFKVTIFYQTGCYKEGSYFIKKHKSSCSRSCSKPITDTGDRFRKTVIPLDESEDENTEKRKSKRGDGIQSGPTESKLGGKSYSFYLLSKRRQVSKEEKQRAYRLATEHSSTQPSFKSVMRPTHVHHYFFVSIPIEWRSKHIPATNDLEIQLVAPPCEKTWFARLKNDKNKFGIGRGWSKFVLDNNLEEGDVCFFELKKGADIVFEVIIFRVVDEVVPLTPWSPCCS